MTESEGDEISSPDVAKRKPIPSRANCKLVWVLQLYMSGVSHLSVVNHFAEPLPFKCLAILLRFSGTGCLCAHYIVEESDDRQNDSNVSLKLTCILDSIGRVCLLNVHGSRHPVLSDGRSSFALEVERGKQG